MPTGILANSARVIGFVLLASGAWVSFRRAGGSPLVDLALAALAGGFGLIVLDGLLWVVQLAVR